MGLYNIISRVNSSLYLNINGYGAGARKKINVYGNEFQLSGLVHYKSKFYVAARGCLQFWSDV